MNSASPRMKRGTVGRGGPGRGRIKHSSGGPQQSQGLEGLYSNDRLVNAVTSVLGCPAKVTGKNGKQFEGVFKTISPEGSLVLGQARQVLEQRQNGVVDPVIQKADIFEQFVMHHKDWGKVEFNNVNLEECLKRDSFKTDVAIVGSKRMNGQTKRELERWAPSGSGDSMETPALEGHHTTEVNGWSADMMFDVNEKMYGVKSTYKEDMEEYTTKLEKSDTPEYREKERFAAQKAEEILKESPYERNTFDSGRSEEQLYSSVVRNKHVDRSSAPNWRQPHSDKAPERAEQRTPKISQDSSSSPVPARKDPVRSQQIDNPPSTTPQVKEKIEKPTTEIPVESKAEDKVEAFSEVVKAETKPDQNVNSSKSPVTPANASVTQVSTQVSTETPQDPTTTSKPSVDAVKTEEIADLKTFSKNFQLIEEKKKTKVKKASDEKEKTLNEATNKDEKDEEPQTPEEVKSESEPASTDNKPGLNPNAQEFRPRVKRNTPSPRSNSSASSSGAPSPFQNNPPFSALSPYPPNGIYTRNSPRGRGMRTDYLDPSTGYVNASNATGQPLFAHHMSPQFLPQPPPPGMSYIPPGSIRHPGVQHPMFIQHPHQSPMIVPVSQMVPQHFPESALYYGTMPMIQSPPQIPSPSLQQSQFNFPSPAIPQSVNPVRPVNQTPVMSQQPSTPLFIVRPSSEIQPNRPPQNQSFQ